MILLSRHKLLIGLALLCFSWPLIGAQGNTPSGQELNSCQTILAGKLSGESEPARTEINAPATAIVKTPEDQWTQAIHAVNSVTDTVKGSEPFVHGIVTAMIAREFIWLNGDPGGAKTFVSRLLFKAALRSIPEQEKKIFVLQFHKLMQEGVITGFPKIKSLLEQGKYEINTASSLVGEQYLFLIADEVEKANPATLNALLSVLNERKAFLGSRVVNASLASGVFTSNKTMGEFIESFGDDLPTGEALADRMAAKFHVPNQATSIDDGAQLYRAVEASRAGADHEVNVVLPVKYLQSLFNRTTVSPELYSDIAELATSFDAMTTSARDASDEARRQGDAVPIYFPANQFSNRSMVKIIGLLKAAHISEQLMQGRPLHAIDLKVTRNDLHLLAQSFTYGSISRVRPKRLSVEFDGFNGFYDSKLKADWDPYNGLLFVRGDDSVNNGSALIARIDRKSHEVTILTDRGEDEDGTSGIHLPKKGLWEILAKAEKSASINPAVAEFEFDDKLEQLLSKRTIPARTRNELTLIKNENEQLTALFNAQVSKPAEPINGGEARQAKFKALSETARSLKQRMRQARTKPDAYKQLQYEGNRDAYIELTTKFPELEHYIKSLFVAMSGRSHVYAFGPPGGAKTMISRMVLGAELASVNRAETRQFSQRFLETLAVKDPSALKDLVAAYRKKDPKGFKMFFLQFHKLLPEGVIVGVPKLQAQIDEGRVEYNFDESLAGPHFIFAILDEVDKANPAVLTSLLSILNEREVFAGSTVVKAGLRTAVLTSNKMPSELYDSFGDDRATAEALHDRNLNKAYIPNKFTETQSLAQMLYDMDHGLATRLESPLNLSIVQDLAKNVTIPDNVLTLLRLVHEEYMGLRLTERETTEAAHATDSTSYPHYYIPAATASNRTWVALLDQLKTRIVVEQMLAGKPMNQLRTEVDMSDLAYFFEGMGYWAPAKVEATRTDQGLLEIKVDRHYLDRYLNSANVSTRQKAQLTFIAKELDDFQSAANQVVQTFAVKYREAIARYPNLFPQLFGSQEALDTWVKENKRANP